MTPIRALAPGVVLATFVALSTAQGDRAMNMVSGDTTPSTNATLDPNRNYDFFDDPNYFRLEAYSGWMVAHIGFMILAWFFVLPIGR